MGTNDYICLMNSLEFLIKYKDGLSLSGIEEKLVIPTNTLKRAIKIRKLPYKHDKKIAEWFGLDVPEIVTRNPEKEQPKLLPMKIGEWKPSIRGYWTNGVISRIPVIVDGERYYEP